MADGYHPPLEEYLEAIYSLSEEGTSTIQARVAERLGHTPQTVSETVHRLIDEGYLTINQQKMIDFTPIGRKLSESIVRRHRLAERFIVEIVGLPWSQAHIEAGRWEHVISPEVEKRFVELLGNPTTCPHGNPIPGTPYSTTRQYPLSEIANSTEVVVKRITEQVEVSHEMLIYLELNGIMPGSHVQINAKTQDRTLMLEVLDPYKKEPVLIENRLADQIFCILPQ
ncbi:MAG: metal-dependent transcriptional regulator [Firmicutes bacterium]|jgi:DtxR family Mn-dependent transcriptional regulator|nr:metal-dependent transcriptional regulator [Bacillota bacterium]